MTGGKHRYDTHRASGRGTSHCWHISRPISKILLSSMPNINEIVCSPSCRKRSVPNGKACQELLKGWHSNWQYRFAACSSLGWCASSTFVFENTCCYMTLVQRVLTYEAAWPYLMHACWPVLDSGVQDQARAKSHAQASKAKLSMAASHKPVSHGLETSELSCA